MLNNCTAICLSFPLIFLVRGEAHENKRLNAFYSRGEISFWPSDFLAGLLIDAREDINYAPFEQEFTRNSFSDKGSLRNCASHKCSLDLNKKKNWNSTATEQYLLLNASTLHFAMGDLSNLCSLLGNQSFTYSNRTLDPL